MTATLPQQGPPTSGGPSPTDRRYGAIYGYDVADHHTNVVHEGDYVGQSRVPELRDRQHRGLAPQRDGQVREQPWADRIVGPMRILQAGMFTDAELDAAELAWMVRCGSRLNCRDSVNPNRIPIYTQRQQRDERDIAAGLQPRDWSRPAVSRTVLSRPVPAGTVPPTGSVWTWLSGCSPVRSAKRRLHIAAAAVLPWLVGVPAVWATLWLVAVLALHQPARQAASNVTSALIGAAILYGLGRAWWANRTRPKRQIGRNRRRTR